VSILVVRPGALTTVQDLGRFGYQRFGVVAGGVMDEWSHRAANLLLGNDENEASLEITLMGPSLVFGETSLIAICGADLSPRVGDQALPMGRPILLKAGSRVDFAARRTGCRAYLAVRGGYKVPPVMHSKSTYVRGGFGGFHGRALRKGDELETLAVDAESHFPQLRRLLRTVDAAFAAPSSSLMPLLGDTMGGSQVVRTIAGQQWDQFSSESKTAFTTSAFRITPNSDRMGFRLQGATLRLRKPIEMISEGVTFGTVQVPPDGDPIVLMADRQATGGYPKIANVASVDLAVLAQLMPSQNVRFAVVSLEEAQRLYLQREHDLRRISRAAETLRQG
jgi:antagonist of KipI